MSTHSGYQKPGFSLLEEVLTTEGRKQPEVSSQNGGVKRNAYILMWRQSRHCHTKVYVLLLCTLHAHVYFTVFS